MKRVVFYGAVLIGLYLAVNYATGASSVLKSGGSAGSAIVQSLQGRA